MKILDFDIAIIGAGLAGIATAYYLSRKYAKTSIVLIDPRPPMSYTSAQSGDNYRNWWPHPVMSQFTNHSIDLMEALAHETSNIFKMNRGGYLLASRSGSIENLLDLNSKDIRWHTENSSSSYATSLGLDLLGNLDGVDVLNNQKLIQTHYPQFNHDIRTLVHIRRAGDISGQQLGQTMLSYAKDQGVTEKRARVVNIEHGDGFNLTLKNNNEVSQIHSQKIINAAGPFIKTIAELFGETLPVKNLYQQKILFEDSQKAVPRYQPFSIDVDAQTLLWTDEERSLLQEDENLKWLTESIPGSVHCRPEGGENANWVKLGWAYNNTVSEAVDDLANDPNRDDSFPEIVIRGASNLNPSLRTYLDKMPSKMIHYGGYYCMTEENWPLIGPMQTEGAYMVGALSGFGTMAACAAGELCADWVNQSILPEYADSLSFNRYKNQSLMRDLLSTQNKGVL